MRNFMPAVRALLVAVALAPATVWAQQGNPPPPPPPASWPPMGPWGSSHMWMDGYGWHYFWGGPFMMLLTILAFVWVMRLLFGHARWRDEFHHGRRHMLDKMDIYPNRSALRILNERYARGEIQKDEYEERKAALLGEGTA